MVLFSPLSTRLLTISAPALSFAYGLVMIKVLNAEQLLQLAASLAAGQLFGALMGLVLGFFHVANYSEPKPYPMMRDLSLILCPILILVSYLNYSPIGLGLIVASFMSTYLDTFFKGFSPTSLVYGRCAQSIFWLVLSVYFLINNDYFININVLLMGRIIGCLLPFIGFLKLVDKKNIQIQSKSKKTFSMVFQTLAWMVGSDAIFTLPVLIMNEILTSDTYVGLVASLIQVSQQLAGRITDYYTTLLRLNHKVKWWDRLLIGVTIVIFLMTIVLLKISFLSFLQSFLIIVISMTVSTLVWSLEASTLTAMVLNESKYLRIAAIAGIFGMVVVVAAFGFCHLFFEDLLILKFWLPTLLGACCYYVCGRYLRAFV